MGREAASVKEAPPNAGDVSIMGMIPGFGRSPGEGNGDPLRYSCLENPIKRAMVHGVAKSQIRLKRLSMHANDKVIHLFLAMLCGMWDLSSPTSN